MSTAVKHNQHFTYGDYLTWPEDERWEVIDGTAYNMTPAPSLLHQEISIELAAQIRSFLRGKKCRAFHAPFDVRLPDHLGETNDIIRTVVQPDITVVCDPTKLDKSGCCGAPDFVIEIISPSTAKKDQTVKAALYERHGVKEYWIVHPMDGLLKIHELDSSSGYAAPRIMELAGTVPVKTLPGLDIDLTEVAALCAQEYPPRITRPSPGHSADE